MAKPGGGTVVNGGGGYAPEERSLPAAAAGSVSAFAGQIPVAEIDPELDQLTNREQEVLRLLARWYAYKEVASRLMISVKTVETHASSVLRKLQLSNRHELSRWAAHRRLI